MWFLYLFFFSYIKCFFIFLFILCEILRAFINILMHVQWNYIVISCVFWLQKLTGHLEEMLQAAYNKFQAWQTRRMMRKTWGDLRKRWKIEKTLGEFKEKGEEQRRTLPAWADWGLMGGFFSQSELEVLVSMSAWGRGLKRANPVILLVHLEMGCASQK